MSGFNRILVPVDGSEISNKALVTALAMARLAGGKVMLVHSLDDLAYLEDMIAKKRQGMGEEPTKTPRSKATNKKEGK